ncbi:MAG: hypothetical protein ACR2H2_20135 [Solirubrobacteraceae bacterium]
MSAVRAALAALAAREHADVPVHGVLCFTTADLLAKRLDADGLLRPPPAIEAVAHVLAAALPCA